MLKQYDMLEKVLSEIENGIKDGINIYTLTEKFSISRGHLSYIFKYILNLTIADYIRSRKFVKSLEDLQENELSILDIALIYGFDYEQTYIRAFKKEFGVTPGQFRKTGFIKHFHGQNVKNMTDLYIKPEIIMKPKFWTNKGINYAVWRNNGKTAMALTGNGSFNCKWEKCKKVIFRIGKIFDETKTHSQLGKIKLDFAADYYPEKASMLCVYGWSVNPLIEYFIVENGNTNLLKDVNKKGTAFIDGSEYIVYEKNYIKRLTIKGMQTFKQYWSVRVNMRNSGIVSVSEHFRTWETFEMNLGAMFETALMIISEDKENSGTAGVYRNILTVGNSDITSYEKSGEETKNRNINCA